MAQYSQGGSSRLAAPAAFGLSMLASAAVVFATLHAAARPAGTALAAAPHATVVRVPATAQLRPGPSAAATQRTAAPAPAARLTAAALRSRPDGGETPAARWTAAVLRSLWAAPVVLLAGWAASRRVPALGMASTTGEQVSAEATDADYVFATHIAEIPKGTRKLLSLRGASVLLFWYRNELYAIENRSPAEGAFNQGFEQARFTQNFGILCPSTDTEFSLKTGEVLNWMPNNSVLRILTPPCPPLEVFPVQVRGEDVFVQVMEGERYYFDGGARSSFDRNNVFGIEPRMSLEDGTYVDEMGTMKVNVDPSTVLITVIAVAIIAVAGTATCLYFENLPALVLFWLTGFGITAKLVLDLTGAAKE